MITGDGAYIKKINRSIIIEKIIEHRAISRASLSKLTGLNKATISDQISDLLEEELVSETRTKQRNVGRRPLLLSINKTAGYMLGIDFNYKKIQFMVSDLLGNINEYNIITFETEDYNEIILLVQKQIRKYQTKYTTSLYGLIGCVIGVHGTIDKHETVNFVPRYQWRNINFKKDLQNGLNIELILENNANLSAFAEKVYHPDSSQLLAINLSSGIGAGNMVDWKLNKGYHGHAGEMGHMIISLDGPNCRCGNKGCWELYASESGLFNRLSKQLDTSNITYDKLKKLIADNNSITQQVIHEYLFYVALGLNNVINLYNPEIIVLNSKALKLYPDSIQIIKGNMHSNVSEYRDITLSELGEKAGALGACFLGIQRFFRVTELSLLNSNE